MSDGMAPVAISARAGGRLRYDPIKRAAAGNGPPWSLEPELMADGHSLSDGERRADPRLGPTGLLCQLVGRRWFASWRRDVLIVNISRGGALVFVDEAPPCPSKLTLVLQTPARKVSVPASVLEVRRMRTGQAAVRIAFYKRWPYSLFESAVCGQSLVRPHPDRPEGPSAPGPERDTPEPRSEP